MNPWTSCQSNAAGLVNKRLHYYFWTTTLFMVHTALQQTQTVKKKADFELHTFSGSFSYSCCRCWRMLAQGLYSPFYTDKYIDDVLNPSVTHVCGQLWTQTSEGKEKKVGGGDGNPNTCETWKFTTQFTFRSPFLLPLTHSLFTPHLCLPLINHQCKRPTLSCDLINCSRQGQGNVNVAHSAVQINAELVWWWQ